MATVFSLKRADCLLANSKWTARKVAAASGRKVPAIIQPSVDLRIFKPLLVAEGSAEGSAEGMIHVVSIGRMAPSKGLPDLIDSLEMLRKDGWAVQCSLASREKLEIGRFPKDVGVSIIRPANDQELAAFYRSGDVFVSCSWSEGFSLPPLEAMACGIPVVAADSGGINEYAEHLFNCILVPPREPAAIAKAMKDLMSDAVCRARLIEGGLQTARRFHWEHSRGKLEKIILAAGEK